MKKALHSQTSYIKYSQFIKVSDCTIRSLMELIVLPTVLCHFAIDLH